MAPAQVPPGVCAPGRAGDLDDFPEEGLGMVQECLDAENIPPTAVVGEGQAGDGYELRFGRGPAGEGEKEQVLAGSEEGPGIPCLRRSI